MSDFASARHNMVEGQIRPNKVTDAALVQAMLDVPRELFVPKSRRSVAYIDEDVHLGNGRYLVEPMVLARLLNEARVDPTDEILDIGCGPGYSTALLARLGQTVVAVDADAALADAAQATLAELAIDNAVVMAGDMVDGYPDQAPFDVILINGSVASVPRTIMDQLKDGGRLLAVLAPRGGIGEATLFQKISGVVSRRGLFNAATPWLPGFEPAPVFEF